jgi:hypothetical protein
MQWNQDLLKDPKEREWLHFEVAEDGVDVLLVLGTDSMIEKAVCHGHKGPLYMDATHGLNDKGLKVVTLHVKDLEGKGELLRLWARKHTSNGCARVRRSRFVAQCICDGCACVQVKQSRGPSSGRRVLECTPSSSPS